MLACMHVSTHTRAHTYIHTHTHTPYTKSNTTCTKILHYALQAGTLIICCYQYTGKACYSTITNV